MVEWIIEKLGLVYREAWALREAAESFKGIFDNFSFKGAVAGGVAVVELMSMLLFGTPVSPRGQEIDLSGYELVFYDEFEGDTLDSDKWYYRGSGADRGGFTAPSQVSLKDGNVVLTGEYLADGEYGAGWYGGEIALHEWYKNGYFEIRCICSEGDAFWSAFWLQAEHPYEAEYSNGGVGGAELDIFECFDEDCITSTIHCAGVDGEKEGFQSAILGDFKVPEPYEQYNTYGLEWTEDEYIFYINGVETTRSTFGNGVCEEKLQPIVSLCTPDAEKFEGFENDYQCQFIVDYVKIYQK
ncbi:MAG: glycoside hydrolase family 16 protein [Clostridia bacterium]|nr:glycoside hydrolase family 16 protein [Clostridia bacterium]